MDSYKITLTAKEEMIIYKDLDMKNKRDEYFQQFCEYKSMIENLTRTCAIQQIITKAKDHRYEKMVKEINCIKIKNDKVNSNVNELNIKLQLAKNDSNQFKSQVILLKKEVEKLKNQQLHFNAYTYNVQAKRIKTTQLVKDSRNMLNYYKGEIETKDSLRFEFEQSQKEESRYL